MFEKCRECGKDLGRIINTIDNSSSALFQYHIKKIWCFDDDQFGDILWCRSQVLWPVCKKCQKDNKYYRVPKTDEEKKFINDYIGYKIYPLKGEKARRKLCCFYFQC